MHSETWTGTEPLLGSQSSAFHPPSYSRANILKYINFSTRFAYQLHNDISSAVAYDCKSANNIRFAFCTTPQKTITPK